MTLFVTLYPTSEAYLELCQTYKIWLLAVNCLRKTLHLKFWQILNVDISYVTLWPQTWNLETLKLWKLHLKFLLCVLASSELDISNVGMSSQIWKLETLKPSLFRCLPFPSKLDISNVNISNVDISHVTLSGSVLIIKNKICNFKIRNVSFSNKKNMSISNTKNVPLVIMKRCPFQIQNSGVFKNQKCIIFKYKKCAFFKYEKENLFISNTVICHVQILKMHLFQI